MSLGVTRALPTPAELRARLNYDPATGALAWKARVGPDVQYWNARYAGVRAGSVNSAHGYLEVRFGKRNLKAHRIAWAIVTGEWPPQEVDHINGDKLDNSWANLRAVGRKTNAQNKRKSPVTRKTPLPMGVRGRHNKSGITYSAQIHVEGRMRHLGTFSTPDAAHEAYIHAKRKHHAGCTI